MSAAPASGAVPTAKAIGTEKPTDATKDQKPATTLEEDDEFEDFPVENWTQEDTEVPGDNTHLWEESWDDDDTSEDFSAQLKYVPHTLLFHTGYRSEISREYVVRWAISIQPGVYGHNIYHIQQRRSNITRR
ncbi:hypothetical protein EYC84_010478 [Monilinia fructicola]|uniref:26S proteasome complex subunit SEM1 n=1 Tax=Monilinia fructicola TaxID=38448 RepID=A0A5M9JDP6_MONFR|nr:hypothetical protein EYC84_010478 [Monilinia fructicola]